MLRDMCELLGKSKDIVKISIMFAIAETDLSYY